MLVFPNYGTFVMHNLRSAQKDEKIWLNTLSAKVHGKLQMLLKHYLNMRIMPAEMFGLEIQEHGSQNGAR